MHSNFLLQHASYENCTKACHEELKSSKRKLYELKKTFYPGFVISFDNIDIQLQRKNMTMHSQNQDFHWVNHLMVENRVSGVHLDSPQPKANAQDVSNLKFIPSIGDQQQQRKNYIIRTLRILVQYFKVLEPLKEACMQYIPHRYMAEIKEGYKLLQYPTSYISFKHHELFFQFMIEWLYKIIYNYHCFWYCFSPILGSFPRMKMSVKAC